MQLRIVTPKGAKAEETVNQVTIPGELGDMGILPGHLPLLSGLGIGELSYTTSEGATGYFAVAGGYVEVADDDVIVVTETAEAPGDIDTERAKASLGDAERELTSVDASNANEVRRVVASIKRAENRLEVAKRR